MSALREMQTAPEALPTVLTSLPPLLARRVFLAVPADARGRACCVCRAWRDALVDAWFWTRVDLTPEGGVAGRRADDKEKAMLLAAVGRARWQLEALCVSHISDLPTLLEVLRDNALSLRELSVGSSYHDPPTLEALVAAAPQLRTLNAWTRCSVTEAPRLLRAESPLKCLTLHNIWLEYGFHDLKDAEAAAPDGVGRRLFDALGDPLVQPSLLRIDMRHLGSWQPITTTALVDSLRARRLRVLQFDSCAPFPAELLARMIVGGALTELRISGHHNPRVLFAFWKEPLYDPPHAILVAAALRATTTLTILEFCHTNLAIKDAGAAMILLNALVGHNTLRSLTVREALMGPVQARLLGTVLGNIVAADAPTLATLCVAGPWQRYDPFMQLLNEDGLKPILDALPRNRHLLKLDISHNEMGTAFARNELLRAVRANRSLRELTYELYVIFPQPGAREAMELVRRRSH